MTSESALEEKKSTLNLLSALGTVEDPKDLDLEEGGDHGDEQIGVVAPVAIIKQGYDEKKKKTTIVDSYVGVSPDDDDDDDDDDAKKEEILRHVAAVATDKKLEGGGTTTKVDVGIPGVEPEVVGTATPLVLQREAARPACSTTATPGAVEIGRVQHLEPSNSVRSLGLTSSDDDDDSLVVEEGPPPEPEPQGEDVILDGSLVSDTQEGDNNQRTNYQGLDAECNSSTGHLSLVSLELVEGKIISDDDDKRNTRTRQCWSCTTNKLLVLLVLVVIVGLAAFLGPYFGLSSASSEKETDEPNNVDDIIDPSSGSQSMMIVYPPFENKTIPTAIAKAIQNVGSPQYYANIWMLGDPYRETHNIDRQWQRFHMVTWYYISNGQSWLRNDHWLSYDVNECSWYNQHSGANLYGYESLEAVDVCNDENQILSFNLSANNLTGRFGQITHFLPHMKRFDISKNYVGGLLPVMAYQPEVEVYDVSDNQFDGILVGSFSSFGIKVIKTHGNALFGYTPALWQFLNHIEHLDVSENLYNSPLVTQMGLCREMKTINLSNNLYLGNIPSELGSLPLLRNYNISNNHEVNGTIPSEFGLLSTLEIMDLSGTRVSGDIPEPLCDRYREGLLQIVANCSHLNCCTT